MLESVFLHPESIAYLKEKPYLSFLSLLRAQTSLVQYLDNSDLVPGGNINSPP
jgi:hypothetical protein